MPEQTKGLSRRRLIAGAGGGAAVGAAAGFLGGRAGSPAEAAGTDGLDLSQAYDFYTGDHQVGIATPPQRHLVFMSLDVVEGTTAEQLKVLFARWSAAMATMMKGNPVGSVEPSRSNGVPQDTGEAYDLSPASLTITLGLGPGLFDDRFGLAGKGPKLLAEIPRLPADELKPCARFDRASRADRQAVSDRESTHRRVAVEARDLARVSGQIDNRHVA